MRIAHCWLLVLVSFHNHGQLTAIQLTIYRTVERGLAQDVDADLFSLRVHAFNKDPIIGIHGKRSG